MSEKIVNTQNFSYKNPLYDHFDKEFVRNLPQQPGVYFFLDEKKRPLYIGKADNLHKRLSSYWLAKPGNVADHTLEMLELANDIRWEIHPSGQKALKREGDLIRAIKPPYNIAGTEPMPYLFIGFKHKGPIINFRLSSHPVQDGYRLFGCYARKGKVKSGYSALLRLLHVSVTEKNRFHIPARICHVSPPYHYKTHILSEWVDPLAHFLEGKNLNLLRLITFRMLENESLPTFMIPSLQKDLEIAKTFFREGPSVTRKVAYQLGIKKAVVTPSNMNELIVSSFRL